MSSFINKQLHLFYFSHLTSVDNSYTLFWFFATDRWGDYNISDELILHYKHFAQIWS